MIVRRLKSKSVSTLTGFLNRNELGVTTNSLSGRRIWIMRTEMSSALPLMDSHSIKSPFSEGYFHNSIIPAKKFSKISLKANLMTTDAKPSPPEAFSRVKPGNITIAASNNPNTQT